MPRRFRMPEIPPQPEIFVNLEEPPLEAFNLRDYEYPRSLDLAAEGLNIEALSNADANSVLNYANNIPAGTPRRVAIQNIREFIAAHSDPPAVRWGAEYYTASSSASPKKKKPAEPKWTRPNILETLELNTKILLKTPTHSM